MSATESPRQSAHEAPHGPSCKEGQAARASQDGKQEDAELVDEALSRVAAHSASDLLGGLGAARLDTRGIASCRIDRWAAAQVATAADGIDLEGLGVFPVVVLAGRAAAVSARQRAGISKLATSPGARDFGVRGLPQRVVHVAARARLAETRPGRVNLAIAAATNTGAVHGSGRRSCLGLGATLRLLTQDAPPNIGSQLFAPDAGHFLDPWAVLRRDVLALPPHVRRTRRHADGRR